MIELIIIPALVTIFTNLAKRLKLSSELVAALLALLLSLVYGLVARWNGGQSIGDLGAFAADVFVKANGWYALYIGWQKKDSLKGYIVKQGPAS